MERKEKWEGTVENGPLEKILNIPLVIFNICCSLSVQLFLICCTLFRLFRLYDFVILM